MMCDQCKEIFQERGTQIDVAGRWKVLMCPECKQIILFKEDNHGQEKESQDRD